jgi:hypothetical protein
MLEPKVEKDRVTGKNVIFGCARAATVENYIVAGETTKSEIKPRALIHITAIC